jgi:glycosyltransferase involved in cell wall biosynthesis
VVNCHAPGAYKSLMLAVYVPIWWVYEFFYLLFHRVDCIYAADLDTVVPALCAGFLKRAKVIFDIHDSLAAQTQTVPKRLRPCLTFMERICARLADVVLIPDASRVEMLGRKPPKRLVVAENCPYDRIAPALRKPENKDLVIFYAGLIANYRGLEKLVRVTAGLEGVKVVIAGRILDPFYEDLFKKTPQIEYLGILSREQAQQRTFDADAVYCYYDPAKEINRRANSTKMFESFMCGTAVLANSEPPSMKLVQEHGCGSYLPFDDDEGLRDVIMRWRDNRELARQAGRNGRRLFETRYNWAVVSQPILELFREWYGWPPREQPREPRR